MSAKRREGHSKLHGRPLDENGAIEFTVEQGRIAAIRVLEEMKRHPAVEGCKCRKANDQYAGSVEDEWTVTDDCPIHSKPVVEDARILRCQARSEECGQCELRDGHESKHLAGYLMWGEDATPRTPLRDDIVKLRNQWQETVERLEDGARTHQGMPAEMPFIREITSFKARIAQLDAALAAVTPEPREATGELEAWVRLVPHIGHKEFKGSFESTTEFSTGCVRCNLQKLTQGPTIRTPLNNFVANLRMRAKRISYSPVQASTYLQIADELEAALRGPTIDDVCKGRSDA